MGSYAYFGEDRLKVLDDKGRSCSEIVDLAKMAVKHHCLSDQSALYFKEVEKAEDVTACTGDFYFLTIRVVDSNSDETKIIEKMIWKGDSIEVLPKIQKRDGCLSISQMEIKNGILKLSAELVLDEVDPTLELVAFTFAHTGEPPESIPTGSRFLSLEGCFIQSVTYDLTIDAKSPGTDNFVTIDASVLHKCVRVIVEGDDEDKLQFWRNAIRHASHPPRPTRTSPLPRGMRRQLCTQITGRGFECCELDLLSPQILTQAWFAVENFNLKRKKKLFFVKVESAKCQHGAGTTYDLTIRATMNWVKFDSYTTTVRDIPWIKKLESITPLTRMRRKE